MTVLVIGVPIAMCSLIPLASFSSAPDFRDARSVYRFKDGAWTAAPPVPGGAWNLQVSEKGTVWTDPATRGGLGRLDGDHWAWYGPRDFGTQTTWVRGGFALLREEVWGATDEGVVHFDGERWQVHPSALKTDRPAAIVAGRSGVWVVDDDGNLSHFDGANWSIQALGEVMSAPAKTDADPDPPRLAMSATGTVWVRWRGLWRQDGGGWRKIQSPDVNFDDTLLIGHSGENAWVWLWTSGELAEVTPEGRIASRYRPSDTGLAKRIRIHTAVAVKDRLWLATGGGLLSLSGGKWRNQGCPRGSCVVTDVAAAPDGSVWVVGETRSLSLVGKFIGPPLAACAIALIAIGLLISAWLRGRAENRLANEHVLVAAAGDLPGLDLTNAQAEIDSLARAMRWKLCGFLVGFPLFVFAVSDAVPLLHMRWPNTPEWLLYTAVLAPVAVACVLLMVRAIRRRGTSRYRQALWGPVKWILYIAVLSFVLGYTPLAWVDRLIPIAPIAGLVRFGIVIGLVTMIVSGREIVAILLVKPAWRVGNYDRAMVWLKRLSLGRPSAKLIEMEGLTHVMANRPEAAERCLRTALARSGGTSRATRVGILGPLGEAMKDQGRDQEARQCLQGCIDMGDNILGSCRIDLAELLLKKALEPERALELVDEAMRMAKGPVAPKVEPSRSATRAWALALLGRRQEATEAIERAMRLRRDTYAPLFADTRLKAAMAMLAMDQKENAIAQFRAAHEADPHGKYGAEALRLLKLHSA